MPDYRGDFFTADDVSYSVSHIIKIEPHKAELPPGLKISFTDGSSVVLMGDQVTAFKQNYSFTIVDLGPPSSGGPINP